MIRLSARPNDPSFSQPWGLQNSGQAVNGGGAGVPASDIRASDAWNLSSGSIANVVDTGIDYTHPDLTANMWSAPSPFTVSIGGVAITCPAGTHGFNAIAMTCDPMFYLSLNALLDAGDTLLAGSRRLPSSHGTVRQWLGDSRGRWEGDTLVVDTVNFTNKTSFNGSRENLHLIERFKRVDADTVQYEVTVEDPTTFVKPWTIAVPMTARKGSR